MVIGNCTIAKFSRETLIEWPHHTFHHFDNIVLAPLQFRIQQISPFCSAVFWSVRLQTTTFMIKIDCFHFQDQNHVFSKIISTLSLFFATFPVHIIIFLDFIVSHHYIKSLHCILGRGSKKIALSY